MNLTARIRGIFTPRRKNVVRAAYEAANWSFIRSLIQSPVTDAKKDISRASRTEVLRKARHFYQNSPVARAVIERLVTYTVGGSGIQPSPKSTSERWNDRARRYWDGWARACDVTGRMSLPTYQRVMVRAILLDGDCFSLLIDDKRLQLIEGHRIGSPTGNGNDGVITDDAGRPLRYQLLNDQRQLEDELPAESIIQHLFLERANQPRGISVLASTINTLHDVDDILAMEKQAVKSASSITDVIKTTTGELNYEDTVRAGGATGPDMRVHYEQVFGASAKIVRLGDEFAQYRSERPASTWLGYMEFLVNFIALSTGFPPGVLLFGKMGGADTRKDLATAQRVVEAWQAEIAGQMQRVWEHVIDGAPGLGSMPSSWRDVDWQFPVRITVDAGREAQADREDVRTGLVSLEEYCGRYGIDWRTHVQQLSTEQKAVTDADKTGMLASRLYTSSGNPPPGVLGEEPEPEPEPGLAGESENDEEEPARD